MGVPEQQGPALTLVHPTHTPYGVPRLPAIRQSSQWLHPQMGPPTHPDALNHPQSDHP